jgi:hypothetical protein
VPQVVPVVTLLLMDLVHNFWQKEDQVVEHIPDLLPQEEQED